jgi:hypothetical protein
MTRMGGSGGAPLRGCSVPPLGSHSIPVRRLSCRVPALTRAPILRLPLSGHHSAATSAADRVSHRSAPLVRARGPTPRRGALPSPPDAVDQLPVQVVRLCRCEFELRPCLAFGTAKPFPQATTPQARLLLRRICIPSICVCNFCRVRGRTCRVRVCSGRPKLCNFFRVYRGFEGRLKLRRGWHSVLPMMIMISCVHGQAEGHGRLICFRRPFALLYAARG